MLLTHKKIFNEYGLAGKKLTVEKAERIGSWMDSLGSFMDSLGFLKKLTDVASSNREGKYLETSMW